MQHQNIVFYDLLKHVPWAVFSRLVIEHNADWDDRMVTSKAHFIAMLYAQFCGARSLREIETNLRSHASKLYHLGGETISKSLSTANADRPAEIFGGLLSALMLQLQAGYRRKIGDCVRLIDSTSVQLSSLSGKWATFSAGVCGAKAHIVYDPVTDQPLYLMVTPSTSMTSRPPRGKSMPGRPTFSTSAITITPGGQRLTERVAASSAAASSQAHLLKSSPDRPVAAGSSGPSESDWISSQASRRVSPELFCGAVADHGCADRLFVTGSPLSHDANKIRCKPAHVCKTHPREPDAWRSIADLLKPPPRSEPQQPRFDFGTQAARAAR